LLVAGLVVGQELGVLVQSLTDPGDVAMAENAKTGGEEPVLAAVPLHVLGGQEADQGLGHREPHLRLLP